ncbi:unnamed protein product [Zymoseptoria tritici ST99CH_3D7]|uniref:Enoyl reductase (ER) domain-containing protein n=1 Tax=Zymoseptoria tritici (strain ST99CH_3D7) TaxID=1276538 RepID=A0A1X7S681_ZYMT9|nr:unnamed protein product [Zymoseptoria tritici ST99CH_3D7]
MATVFSPKNAAAWILHATERPLVVSNSPYTKPPKGHVVIKVYDVAVNPIDWILQDSDLFKLQYPTILGSDVAGEIVEVADDVKDFRIGTRVIAHCTRSNADLPSGATGAFQRFVVVPAVQVAELPSKIRSSAGVVLPLGVSTASAGLYQKGYLSLPLPTTDEPKPLHRTILIWGGSSSVGSCAIQLAVASGVEVITTASPANSNYCKDLGAKEVFDYHENDVEKQVGKYLEGKTLAGVFHAVGADGAVEACARIAAKAEGKAVVVTVRGVPEKGIPGEVRVKAISATDIFSNEVGPYIWRDFLPKALKSDKKGAIVPKPDPKIVGEGLRSVQLGLDTQKKGVSAKKVVVSYISS